MQYFPSYLEGNATPPYSSRPWYKESPVKKNHNLPVKTNAYDEWSKENSEAESSLVNPLLQIMLNDLEECENSSEYDGNYQQPSNHAVRRTRQLLQDAIYNIGHDIPLGTLLPDGDGGIRIEWLRESRELSLMIPEHAYGKEYLYHEAGNVYEAKYDVTSHSLAQWLEWLENGNPEEK